MPCLGIGLSAYWRLDECNPLDRYFLLGEDELIPTTEGDISS